MFFFGFWTITKSKLNEIEFHGCHLFFGFSVITLKQRKQLLKQVNKFFVWAY